MAITRDAEQDTHFDPSACVEVMGRKMGLDGLDGVDFPRNPQMVTRRKAVLRGEVEGPLFWEGHDLQT